jgi:hypothetical protein
MTEQSTLQAALPSSHYHLTAAMAAESSQQWDSYIASSLLQIQTAQLERVLRPVVPDGSSAVQVCGVQPAGTAHFNSSGSLALLSTFHCVTANSMHMQRAQGRFPACCGSVTEPAAAGLQQYDTSARASPEPALSLQQIVTYVYTLFGRLLYMVMSMQHG